MGLNENARELRASGVTGRLRSFLSGQSPQVVIITGFMLTMGIWLFAGYYFIVRMSTLEERTAEVGNKYMRAQELISGTRSHIYRASIYARDALLTQGAEQEDYRKRLEQAFADAEAAMGDYAPVLDEEPERNNVARLRREIGDLRAAMIAVLAADDGNDRNAGELLRTRLIPKRNEVLKVAEDLQGLNRASFVQHQITTAELYRQMQSQFLIILGLAMVGSLGVAVAATIYTGRLQARLKEQQKRDEQSSKDLQRLSDQLIRAQEEERRAIARELHDEVGQVLTAVKVELSCAQREIEAAGGGLTSVLDDARSVTDRALHTVRDLSHLLHPALLDDLGLAAAIDWYVKGYRKRHGIRVDLTTEEPEPGARLIPETEAAVYRIVQEALTNIVKHAQATACEVSLRHAGGVVSVRVQDNGVGFVPEQVGRAGGSRGLGFISIRERVDQLGGKLKIQSGPGQGTCISVELPAVLRATGGESYQPDIAQAG